ncbi:hypothetical protein BT96DRAFT_971015 [Gymnopus androsaceus JB14]|uniref:Zn(2)-C6 fungal-type domain-containing protein n=1 Tax=Gymnopus androsaceus JB14 TaxID=1447944 RepID=A0A6A4IGR2_9AGAR|nr:hypothetical protein BT96DRAFT_971015 [Gymnopus androsaceus JB14]
MFASGAPLENYGGFRRRRLQGACDICRRKKTRCDSANMPGNICSNCRTFGSECTHLRSALKKKRGEEPIASGSHQNPSLTPLASLGLNSPDFEFAKSQIDNILSISTPYKIPDDAPLVLKTLTEIALYARTLENELSTYKLNSFAGMSDGGSEITRRTPLQVHSLFNDSSSTEDRPDDWDTYMANVDELLRSLNALS